MVAGASELLRPPPGVPAIGNYVYANGLWRAVGGSDQGDGTAALLVTGAGAAPAATSLKLQDGTTNTQFAAVDANGSVHVNVIATPAGQSVAVTSLPGSPAQDGTDGATPPTIPGTGIRGWLRSIYDKLNGTLTTSVSNFPATQAVSGTVGVNNFPATQPISGNVGLLAGTNVVGHVIVDPGSYTSDTYAAKIGQGKARIGGHTLTTSLTSPNAYITVINPAANTRVVYIVGFDIYASATTTVNYMTGATDTNPSIGTLFNPNLAVSAASSAIVQAGVTAPTGGTTQPVTSVVVANAPVKINLLLVVPPGGTMGISATGAASGSNITANVFLYEE